MYTCILFLAHLYGTYARPMVADVDVTCVVCGAYSTADMKVTF